MRKAGKNEDQGTFLKEGYPRRRARLSNLRGRPLHLSSAGNLDPANVEFLCSHYRKVFAVFRAFVRMRCPGIADGFDWSRLEEGIRQDPARFTSRDYFETLSDFFGLTPSNDR